MVQKLEVAVKNELNDPLADSIKKRVLHDLGINLEGVRTKRIFLLDTDLTEDELEQARKKVFMDPQVDVSSFNNIPLNYNKLIHIPWKPGVTDNTGKISVEALETMLNRKLNEHEKVYSSTQICLQGDISREQAQQIGGLFATEVVQDILVYDENETPKTYVPKMNIKLDPRIDYINLNVSDFELTRISKERKLALNLLEMKEIQKYSQNPDVIAKREEIGMVFPEKITDVELETIAQTWSEHCKHKIFNAEITDVRGNIFEGIPNLEEALENVIQENNEIRINSIFDNYIRNPAESLKKELPWIKSILKDNAGVVDFDDYHVYTLKWESHNSPSIKEPYGGAYTGIVGVFRDPISTGRGGRIIAGFWSFHTGSPNYDGELLPELHPSVILEGVRRGVEHGGNRSGNPTITGFVYFHDGFIPKPYIGVGASSIMPKEIDGKPSWEKIIDPGDLAILIGGRVGIDGIHGATESSMSGGEHISAGHVQVGDAYTQKKAQDFINELVEKGISKAAQDLGAGGVSSAFGELSEITNGSRIDLKKHPVKYAGLMPFQIKVSESQERFAFAIEPKNLKEAKELAKKHDVELTVLGNFENTGYFHTTYGEIPCCYLDMNFLHNGTPQMKLKAEWKTPDERGLAEPALPKVKDHNKELEEMLSDENIASYNYIVRQFDHEVQGGSTIKPLQGVKEDVHGDASIIRPVLDSNSGICFSAANNPDMGEIDTYHMTMLNFDEAIRRVIASGGDVDQIPMNDNFGWPSPIEAKDNPDAKYKTAQLWRAAKAVHDGMLAYKAPCISGKDSMSLDGTVKTKNSGKKKVCAPPMVQMSTAAKIKDTRYCLTMDPKEEGDLIYVLGITKDELGGSQYYRNKGEIGRNAPVVNTGNNIEIYNSHSEARSKLLLESSHGVYKGGLGVHLALTSIAGDCGLEVNLKELLTDGLNEDAKVLYSESAGRLIVTVSPDNKERFEEVMKDNYSCIGKVKGDKTLKVYGLDNELIINESVDKLSKVYHSAFDSDINKQNMAGDLN